MESYVPVGFEIANCNRPSDDLKVSESLDLVDHDCPRTFDLLQDGSIWTAFTKHDIAGSNFTQIWFVMVYLFNVDIRLQKKGLIHAKGHQRKNYILEYLYRFLSTIKRIFRFHCEFCT